MAKASKLKKVEDIEEVKNPVFNPEKSYGWKADDTFTITGSELDLINKVLDIHLQKPETQQVLGLIECKKITSSLIEKGVKSGIIKEVESAQS